MTFQTHDSTMQAAVLTGHGGPARIELVDDHPRPAAGPGEVLIQVGAAGINNTDVWSREGAYSADPEQPEGWRGVPLSFPRIQGGDVAGTITAVGDGVPESRIGQRVLVNALLYGDDGNLLEAGLLGSERDGGFAEYVTVPAANAHPVAGRLSDAELATFPIAWLTALHMLNRARLAAGERVVVTGASGGVGTALVALAAARGAQVTAVSSRAKFEHITALGASACLDRSHELTPDAVCAAAGGAPDVVADVVGGGMFAPLFEALAPGGRFVTAGAIAGARVTLDLRRLYLPHREVIGSTMGTQAEFAELVELIESGRLEPQLAGTWPLSRIHDAQRAFDEKGFAGKLVLIPDARWEANTPETNWEAGNEEAANA